MWLLYFDRVFVQYQTWLLCLLLIFAFSNDVCFMPLAPLPMPCWGVSPWAPTPHRGSALPWGRGTHLGPWHPCPILGGSYGRR